jgi:hypothetical protein
VLSFQLLFSLFVIALIIALIRGLLFLAPVYKCNLIYLIGITGAKNNKPLINAMISAITNSENSN